MMGCISRREAAEALGFSRQRLEKLIRTGRITETDAGIDIDRAKREYEATLDPVRLAAWRGHLALQGKPAAAKPAGEIKPEVSAKVEPPVPKPRPAELAPATAEASSDGAPASLSEFNLAKTRKAVADATKAELDVKEREGLLLRREDVERMEFAVARKVRDRILGLPSRLATYVTPEARKVIDDECQQLITELMADVQRMVTESGSAA